MEYLYGKLCIVVYRAACKMTRLALLAIDQHHLSITNFNPWVVGSIFRNLYIRNVY